MVVFLKDIFWWRAFSYVQISWRGFFWNWVSHKYKNDSPGPLPWCREHAWSSMPRVQVNSFILTRHHLWQIVNCQIIVEMDGQERIDGWCAGITRSSNRINLHYLVYVFNYFTIDKRVVLLKMFKNVFLKWFSENVYWPF